MSVVERMVTSDPHRECRARTEKVRVGGLAQIKAARYLVSVYERRLEHLRELACVDDNAELEEFITRRRASDVEVGALLDRLDAAEHRPWSVADKETLAGMHLSVGAVIVDAQDTAWHRWAADWRTPGWTWSETDTPCSCAECQEIGGGPVFPVTILHTATAEYDRRADIALTALTTAGYEVIGPLPEEMTDRSNVAESIRNHPECPRPRKDETT